MDYARAVKVLQALHDLGVDLAPTVQAGPPPWCPQKPTGKQRDFLAVPAREALYGGAAGGGKSSCLLMAALQHVDRPGYAALLMRRTYRDLALPGALMDRAAQWLRPTAARWREVDKQWIFPSGATLTFGYMEGENDKYRYQGAEFQFIGYDELTQATESQYTYLLSRLRRLADVDIPLRMRAASNPGGVGHNWVKERFVEGDGAQRAFIPARLEDNPHLDQGAYRESLDQLDDLTRRQLLLGEWVTDAGGLIYVVTKDNLVDKLPRDHWEYVLAVDLGASMTRPTTAFQVVAFNEGHPFTYLVESSQHAMGSPGAVAEEIHRYMARYDFMTIAVDQGGLGRGYIEEFTNRYRIPAEEGQNRNKLGYRRLMRGDLERGLIKIVEPANGGLIKEMAQLRWNDTETDCDKHARDHASDAALYAYVKSYAWLAKQRDSGRGINSVNLSLVDEPELDEMELAEERRMGLA